MGPSHSSSRSPFGQLPCFSSPRPRKGVIYVLSSSLMLRSKAGGNFIDCANNYQDEQSEMIVGEWMEKRGIRNDIVLAT